METFLLLLKIVLLWGIFLLGVTGSWLYRYWYRLNRRKKIRITSCSQNIPAHVSLLIGFIDFQSDKNRSPKRDVQVVYIVCIYLNKHWQKEEEISGTKRKVHVMEMEI